MGAANGSTRRRSPDFDELEELELGKARQRLLSQLPAHRLASCCCTAGGGWVLLRRCACSMPTLRGLRASMSVVHLDSLTWL